jgi:hypothetical protein
MDVNKLFQYHSSNPGSSSDSVLRILWRSRTVSSLSGRPPTIFQGSGAAKVYFSVNGAGVFRYTPGDRRLVPVSSGFAFVGGHTKSEPREGLCRSRESNAQPAGRQMYDVILRVVTDQVISVGQFQN